MKLKFKVKAMKNEDIENVFKKASEAKSLFEIKDYKFLGDQFELFAKSKIKEDSNHPFVTSRATALTNLLFLKDLLYFYHEKSIELKDIDSLTQEEASDFYFRFKIEEEKIAEGNENGNYSRNLECNNKLTSPKECLEEAIFESISKTLAPEHLPKTIEEYNY